MSAAIALLSVFMSVNSILLKIGRSIAWVALALMVAVILLQVVARYVFNNALPWPDEAARFLMLWMTGLVAPSAYRWGGFVAIDMLPAALPRIPAALLLIILYVMSALVLIVAIGFGWNHTMGFGGNFNSSSLVLPFDWFGGESVKVKLRYMYMSLLVCMVMMLIINAELILRAIVDMIRPDADLPHDGDHAMARAD